MIESITILALLLVASIHKSDDYMQLQWSIGLALASIPIGVYFYRRMGAAFGIFVTYLMVNTGSLVFYKYSKNQLIPEHVANRISIAGLETGLTCTLLFLSVFFLKPPQFKSIKRAIPMYTTLNALGVVIYWCLGMGRLIQGHGIIGPISLDYSGMNGVLLSLGTPFLIPERKDNQQIKYLKLISLIITFFGVVFSRSCIPYGVMAVCLFTYFVKDLKKAFLILPIPFIVCWTQLGERMLQSSQRFEAYEVFLKYLVIQQWHIFGAGLGSFKFLATTIQEVSGFMMNNEDGLNFYWYWLHSDVLQTVFELGIIGCLISLLVYSQAVYRLWKSHDRKMLSLAIGVLASSVFDYPLRYFSLAFLVTFVLVYSLRKDLLESDR